MMTRQRTLDALVRSFAYASLADKVIVAAAVYAAANGGLDENMRHELKKNWAKALILEISLEKIKELYAKGLADYTVLIAKYSEVAAFAAEIMGVALSAALKTSREKSRKH